MHPITQLKKHQILIIRITQNTQNAQIKYWNANGHSFMDEIAHWLSSQPIQITAFMTQEVFLWLNSHTTYALSTHHLPSTFLSLITQKLKKHGGQWNAPLQNYELPISQAQGFLDEMELHQMQLRIRPPPVNSIRGLLAASDEKGDKDDGLVVGQKKWKRVWLLDPLGSLRHSYLTKWILNKERGKTTCGKESTFTRCLLLCWGVKARHWLKALKEAGIRCQEADSKSLEQLDKWAIRPRPLEESSVIVLTYERLHNVAECLTTPVLSSYGLVMCDDAQGWLTALQPLYSQHSVRVNMKNILVDTYSKEKQLIVVTGSVPAQQTSHLLELCTLIRAKQFGKENLEWLKIRFSKKTQVVGELFFQLHNTLCINKMFDSVPYRTVRGLNISSSSSHLTLHTPQKPEWKQALRYLQKTFKNINPIGVRQGVLESRTDDRYLLNGESKQADYWAKLSTAYNFHKMTEITQWLGHMCGYLQQRVVVMMEKEETREMLEKYLRQQQIKWVNYHIDETSFGKEHYVKFNNDKLAKVCLIVRQTVSHQLNLIKKQWLARGAEQELGMEEGALSELLSRQGGRRMIYDEDQDISMPMITNARHILWIDSHWSSKPQHSLVPFYPIVGFQSQLSFQLSRAPKEGGIESWDQHQIHHRSAVNHHFIIVDEPFQKALIDKQFNRIKAIEKTHQEEMVEKIQSQVTLRDWKDKLLHANKKAEKGSKRMGIVDVNESYDRVEWQARQIKLGKKKESPPKYNTHIEGLIVQTPDLGIESTMKPQREQPKRQNDLSVFKQDFSTVSSMKWIKEQSKEPQKDVKIDSESEFSDCPSMDLVEYLLMERASKQAQEGRIVDQEQSPQTEQRPSSSGSSLESLHLKLPQTDSAQLMTFQNIKKPKVIERETTTEVQIDRVRFPDRPIRQPEVEVIDVDDLQLVQTRPSSQRRTYRTGSLALWGSGAKNQSKNIAPKYMECKVKIKAGHSCITYNPNPYQRE